MSIDVDARGWPIVGATSNCRFFEVCAGVLAVLPIPPATDDEETARENSDFQDSYFRRLGTRGVVIIFFDAFVSQDKVARRVYREAPDPFVLAKALVATSLLGRAIASFALGSRQLKTPMKMFATFEEALPWAQTQLGCAPGKETTR